MFDAQNIEDSIDGVRLTLIASPGQQKTIRSGVFWKRFRFARRTVERIEWVRAALESRSIAFNLDPELFGREPRDERITFSLMQTSDGYAAKSISPEINIGSPSKVWQYRRFRAFGRRYIFHPICLPFLSGRAKLQTYAGNIRCLNQQLDLPHRYSDCPNLQNNGSRLQI